MSEDYQAPSGAGHPITPPPELVAQWRAAASNVPASLSTDPGGRRDYIDYIATQAARWGADQELEACCSEMNDWGDIHNSAGWELSQDLRAARRPKPPSLAEQALAEIQEVEGAMYSADLGCDFTATRRALERLQELEDND